MHGGNDLISNACIRVDEDGVAHYAYLMVMMRPDGVQSPLGYSTRCAPLQSPLGYSTLGYSTRRASQPPSHMLMALISKGAPAAERVTCMLCVASEG